MSTVTIDKTFTNDTGAYDPTSVTLTNAAADKGIVRTDTGAAIVPAGTTLTRLAAGHYRATFTPPGRYLAYEVYLKTVISGRSFYEIIHYRGLPHDTGEFIAEQLAEWLTAALAEITIAGGYQQTLTVTRPEDNYLDGTALNDLSTVVIQSECIEDADPVIGGNSPEAYWRQTYEVNVFLAGDADTGLSIDRRINRVVADIVKRIGLARAAGLAAGGIYCSGLAYNINVGTPDLGTLDERNLTVVRVPVTIAFAFNPNDPYN